MNEEFEIRDRLSKADPALDAPMLNEAVVAKAAMSRKRGIASFKVARLTMAAASMSIAVLAVGSLTFNLGPTSAPLFELAGAGQNQAAMGMESSVAADAKAGPDRMMIWPNFSYNYIPGDLSDQTGRGRVYQAQLKGDPAEILGRLAGYFGVSGEPRPDDWSTSEFPSYSIQNGNTTLGIYFSGTGNWYYSSWKEMDYGCTVEASDTEGAEKPEAGTETESQYCEPQPTPELLPSEAQMKSQAIEIFSAMGIELDPAAARVYRDDWSASISFPNVQLGIDTGMDYYLGWSMDGSLSYVSGYSFELIDRGEFETISALDSVSRISDGRWYGSAPNSYYQALAVSSDAAVSYPSTKDASVEAVDEPAVEPIPEEVVSEFPTEAEIVDLLIERSEEAMLSVYDAQGNLWFVPGYLLFNDQGWFDSIISLEEGVISLEPFDYGILPAEVEPRTD